MFHQKYKTFIAGIAFTVIILGSLVLLYHLVKNHEPFVDFSNRSPAGLKTHEYSRHASSLRFAVATMWSVESTFSRYRDLTERIAGDTGLEESMILKSSYKALRQAMETNEIDVAFVCTGPYVFTLSSGSIRLLVEPEFVEGEQYHSVIIVPAGSALHSVMDLKGMSIAFSDSESFTGYVIPYVMLKEQNIDPDKFFKNIILTGSHDRSIFAVDRGIANAAAVHSIVWESAKREDPSLKDRLREIWSSETFGPPPVIVSNHLRYSFADSLKNAFLNLDKDSEGRKILESIGMKRFVPAREKDYLSALKLYQRYEKIREKN
jgi:phosphonate transport system substrate-binding protein